MWRYIVTLLLTGPFIILDYFIYLIKYSRHPEKYPLQVRYNRICFLSRKVIKHLRVDIHAVGVENIPDKPSLFVSNHLSMFDPLIHMLTIPNKTLSIVAKKETNKMPFVGRCVKAIDGEFLDRSDIKQSLRVMMSIENSFKKDDKHWLIFPEGTRSKDPKLNIMDFHHGTFRPAAHSGAPIVPCCLYGTFRVGKVRPTFKKYPVYVEYGKPLYYEDYKDMTTQDIAIYMNNEVQKMISYHARVYDDDYMSKVNPENYNRNE